MPLPDVALEGQLAVDLELVHVELFAEQVLHRLDHARMARELREGLAVQVRGEVGAHRVLAFLAHVVGLAPAVELGHGVVQGARFFAA